MQSSSELQTVIDPLTCVVFIQNLCTHIRTLPPEDRDKLAIRKNSITGIPEVQCFLEEMADFLDVGNIRNSQTMGFW